MEPLLTELAPLNVIAHENIILATAIFARLSALFFFLPGMGERTMPVRIRLTAALAIMLVILPAFVIDFEPPTQPSLIAAMIAAEAVCGAVLGFSIRVAVYAIQTAGAIASQSLSLAQLFGSNVSFDPETPISTILMLGGIVLAVSAGIHFQAISVLIMSFDVMPLGLFPGADSTGQWAAERAGFAFSTALSLAFPFVVLGFIYNLAIGAANRAMPQLMVAFVGVPAVTFAGMVLLAATAPVLLDVWLNIVSDIIDNMSAGSL